MRRTDEPEPESREPLLGKIPYPRTWPLPAKRVDLHCHSSASNGATGKPADIARKLKEAGFSAFSLTEHDSLASQEAAAEGARLAGIEFVPGIEVSVRVDDPALSGQRYAHVLAFLFRRGTELDAMVGRAYGALVESLRAGFRRLRDRGAVPFDEEALARYTREAWGADDRWKEPFNCPQPLGQMLQKAGLGLPGEAPPVTTSRVLGLSYPPPESAVWPDLREACDTLHRAGAVVVWAHPVNATRPQLRRWLERYGDGLEVYHPRNSPDYRRLLLDVVAETGCAFSGGSDTHWFGWDNMEELYSDAPYDCLESLKAAKGLHH